MTLEEINQKIAETRKAIEKAQVALNDYEQAKKNLEGGWVVASAPGRIILHLAALSSNAKEYLKSAINEGKDWISFDEDGEWGYSHPLPHGLTFYGGTQVIFGRESGTDKNSNNS